jgi:formyl-CoA transferase
MLQRVELEDGSVVPITGPAPKLSRTPLRVRSGAPALGQHTDEVLREIGLPSRERENLRTRGIV